MASKQKKRKKQRSSEKPGTGHEAQEQESVAPGNDEDVQMVEDWNTWSAGNLYRSTQRVRWGLSLVLLPFAVAAWIYQSWQSPEGIHINLTGVAVGIGKDLLGIGAAILVGLLIVFSLYVIGWVVKKGANAIFGSTGKKRRRR